MVHWLLLGILGYFAYPFVLRPTVVRLAAKLPPAREAVFRHAMKGTDPARLADMADEFRREGFTSEADQLRARAALRAHPKETLAKYADVIKRALSSTNVKAIEDVAEAFRKDGATSIAELLDEYAAGLSTLASVEPVVVPIEQLPPASPPGMPPPAAGTASGAVQTPGGGGATVNGESCFVPPGVPADALAALGVQGAPPVVEQYNPLAGKNPFVPEPGRMPDNRVLGSPPGNNPFQSDGSPGIGLPGVMPQRPM